MIRPDYCCKTYLLTGQQAIEKDAETFGPKMAPRHHLDSVPADYSRCWVASKKGDGILIHSPELAADDGIVGQVLSISACTCAGRNITLHGVA